MTINVAPELNGARLQVSNTPQVWLVMHGVRRHIASAGVYDALFSETEDLVRLPDIDHIQRGADLNEGTMLARAEGETGIFLVTGAPDTEVQKYYIASYETFLIYGFDESKVRDVPRIVLGGVPRGPDLHCELAL